MVGLRKSLAPLIALPHSCAIGQKEAPHQHHQPLLVSPLMGRMGWGALRFFCRVARLFRPRSGFFPLFVVSALVSVVRCMRGFRLSAFWFAIGVGFALRFSWRFRSFCVFGLIVLFPRG